MPQEAGTSCQTLDHHVQLGKGGGGGGCLNSLEAALNITLY